jgi:hypothetical protein
MTAIDVNHICIRWGFKVARSWHPKLWYSKGWRTCRPIAHASPHAQRREEAPPGPPCMASKASAVVWLKSGSEHWD